VRYEWEVLGVPPREIETRGPKVEERVEDDVSMSQEIDVGVIHVGMSWCVPGVLRCVDAGMSSLSDIEKASSVRVSPATTLMVEASGIALSADVDVDESDIAAVGRSRPVAAANLICIDSGTPPVLTQGRTVNCLFGRSRARDQLKHRQEG
jgi:hypothetical protein